MSLQLSGANNWLFFFEVGQVLFFDGAVMVGLEVVDFVAGETDYFGILAFPLME